jgi:chromosome partitioning protein
MAVIAISGRKGGIGKTTITGNLAAELAALGHRVAVLDTDPQKSLIKWAALGKGVLYKLAAAVPTNDVRRFKKQLETVSRVADRVLLDTPPGFADPSLLAALLADVVILPAGPSPLDILAAREALEITRRAREKRGTGKPLIRLLPSRVIKGTSLGRDLPAALAGLGEPVLPAVYQRVALAECALSGLTVREYANRSAAQREFAALAKAVEKVLES